MCERHNPIFITIFLILEAIQALEAERTEPVRTLALTLTLSEHLDPAFKIITSDEVAQELKVVMTATFLTFLFPCLPLFTRTTSPYIHRILS